MRLAVLEFLRAETEKFQQEAMPLRVTVSNLSSDQAKADAWMSPRNICLAWSAALIGLRK